jgi:hypothetical protein
MPIKDKKSLVIAVISALCLTIADASTVTEMMSASKSNRQEILKRSGVEPKKLQVKMTSYPTAQYCASTKVYYYSRTFFCPPAVNIRTNYSTAQYCPSTNSEYYSFSFYCPLTRPISQYSVVQFCPNTQEYYYDKSFHCSSVYSSAWYCADYDEYYYSGNYYCANYIAIGGGVSGFVVLFVVILIIWCCCCRKKAAEQPTAQAQQPAHAIAKTIAPMMMPPQPMIM